MTKVKKLITVPNFLDVAFVMVLLAKLLIAASISSIKWSEDFGSTLLSQMNPFLSLEGTIGLGDVSGWAWWIGTRWQWVLLAVVIALVLLGRKRAASIVALSWVLVSVFMHPLIFAIQFSGIYGDFFTHFGGAYGLNGLIEMPGEYFSGGLYFLNQINLGLGLVLQLAFLVFYLIRQFPGKLAEANNVVEEKEWSAMSSKADFCSKCGAAASDGDFCSKCGASLITTNGGTFGYGVSSIPRTSSLAIAAIISVFFVSWVGLVLGYLARREIRESRGSLNGEGMAKAAIWIGWIFTGLAVLAAVIWGILIGIAAGNAYSQ